MSNASLIPKLWAATYEPLLKKELVIGGVASRKFDSLAKNYGDTITVPIGFRPTVSVWTGGDLDAIEAVVGTSVDIVLDQGRQVNFGLTKKEELQIINSKELLTTSVGEAIYGMRDAMDVSLGLLYSDALIIGNSNSTVTVSDSNAFELLVEMAIMMDEAKVPKQGRYAILPSRFLGFVDVEIKNSNINSDVSKVFGSGYRGNLAGFEVYQSENVYKNSSVYHPIFGVKGSTLALAIQNEPELIEYMPEKAISKAYKAGCLYGVTAVRKDTLATVPCSFASLL